MRCFDRLGKRGGKEPQSSIRFLMVLLISVAGSLGSAGCTRSKDTSPNTVHVVVPAKIKGLDPIYSDDLYSGVQVSQVYEPLLRYHYLKRPYVLVPNLLERMPEVSRDRLTYTFYLKKGVLFQDDPCFQATDGKGREMTADDVVYSLKRLADPRNASPGEWILDGKIVGLNAWRDEMAKVGSEDASVQESLETAKIRFQPRENGQELEGIKAVDRYTVRIKLVQPSAQFLYALAMPFTGVVAKEAVEFYGKEFLNHPVGTGPFRLAEYNPSSRIVWTRNPTFRHEVYPQEGEPEDQGAGLLQDAGKPLPLSDQVVVDILVESQPMWLNFIAGNLDLVAIPKDNFSSAMSPSLPGQKIAVQKLNPELTQKGIQLVRSPSVDVTHVAFNMGDPLLGKNKLLRQAMSLAYDEATFIELFYNGRAIPAQGPIPPRISGYNPQFKNPYRQFNIVKAKELLAKAGYPEGKGLPVLDFASLADSTGRQTSEYFQKMMSAIGIKIRMSSYSWPQFQEVVRNRKAQIWAQAWQADYPDAENFLQLFYSKNASPGPNDSGYSNPRFDSLYEASLKLSDGPQRTATYQKMVDLVVEDCPWVFGAHRLSYVLTQPWFKNYKPNDFDHARYQYYRVDSTLKKK